MPRLVVFLPQCVHMVFYFCRRAHGIGKGDKAAAFVFKLGLAGFGQSAVGAGNIRIRHGGGSVGK